MKLLKQILFILSVGIASMNSLRAADAPKSPPLDLKGTRILVCAGYWAGMTGMPAIRKLTDAGAEVGFGDRHGLTWNEIQKYHLIIVIFDNAKTPVKSSDEALQKFVQAGGGVFFLPSAHELKDNINQCLTQFGASFPKEYIEDQKNTFVSPAGFYNLSYAYTVNIAAGHPVTEGVKGIWYDVDAQSDCLFDTSAVEVSKDWTILVSGEDSATTFGLKGQMAKENKLPGKYQSSPPIIAAREYGEGAIVFAGLNALEVFYGQELPYYGDVAIEKGDGQRRSDYGRLYDNALTWLAQHGKKSAALGQGGLKPVKNDWVKIPKFNWADPKILAGAQCKKPIKGVIGLHSTLSDGKGTPEELIAKAKASGLQWVAFTEKMEFISDGKWEKKAFKEDKPSGLGERGETNSPAKWEQLKKICKEASSEDFAALPGLDYADATGTRWVVFGDFEWPEGKMFSPDKKAIIDPQFWFAAFTPSNGPYNVGKSQLHQWDYSLYTMWPVRTTIAGKQTDEAVPGFMHNQGVQDDPAPMAVDMVYSEQDLEEASGRMCNYVTLDKPRDLAKFFRVNNYFASSRSFVSEGPLVIDWRCENAFRTSGGKWYAPSTEQYRIKLSVESAAPIKDIKIYDGPLLVHRVCPNQTNVTVKVDIPHDKQRNLFAVITDANGKKAVTGGQFIRDSLNWRFMCSDRGNSIVDGIMTDNVGPYLMGPSAPYQRKMELFGIFPGCGMRAFMSSPPGVDGGIRAIGMQIIPSVFFQFAVDPKQPKLNPILETRMDIPVCSKDGILQEHTGTGIFDRNKAVGAIGWNCRQIPMDLKDVDINVRYLNITPNASDMGVILLEGRIGFKNPVKLDNPMEIYSSSVAAKPGNGDHYAISTPKQTVADKIPLSTEAPMTSGSYVMIYPAQLGSSGAMALDDGYTAKVNCSYPTNRVAVKLDAAKDMKAGDELKYRLLLIRGRPFEDAVADWENFAKKMGLRGNPAYEVKDIKSGKVKSTKFLLELEPQDGGFAATITGSDLPIILPVRMADMNQNWTFAWFDLDRKEWFPSAIDQVINQGFFTIDTRVGDHRIFAGHPVVADNKELRILVLGDGKSKVNASVNNVGDAAMDAVLRLNPALGKAEPVKVHLESGEVKNLEFVF